MRGIEPEVSVELEVPFHDVDMLQVVWHGHYFKYMELARTALLEKHGLNEQTLRTVGYAFFVIESKCRHTFPLRFRDRFRVDAAFRDVEHRLHVVYEIYNLSHERRSARGHTMLATVGQDGLLKLRTPDVILDRLR